MKVKDSVKCLNAYLDADLPVFLWGPPGIGKSDTVRRVAKERSANIIDLRAITFDPVDLRGLPSISDGKAKWCLPDFLPNEQRDGEVGILFLDELNAAPQSVQAACFQLVLDRRIGDYVLPKRWRIVSAGNRQSDGAAAQKMPTALANRFSHIDIECDAEEWAAWGEENGINECVRSFIQFRPEMLHNMDDSDKRAFPTPRAWASVSRLVDNRKIMDEIGAPLIQGLVGLKPSREFMSYWAKWTAFPTAAQIFNAPNETRIPSNVSERNAIVEMLVKHTTGMTFGKGLTYVARMPKEQEMSYCLQAMNLKPSVKKCAAFREWAKDNPDAVPDLEPTAAEKALKIKEGLLATEAGKADSDEPI